MSLFDCEKGTGTAPLLASSRGGIVSPGHCFSSWGVGMKSEACHAVKNVTRKVKKHVSGKDVWQMCDQGPLCWEGTPLMISGAFAVALLWMNFRTMCPIFQVPLLEVYDKETDRMTHTTTAFL